MARMEDGLGARPRPEVLSAAWRSGAGAPRPGRRFAVLVFIANSALILALWWHGSGSQPVRGLSDALNVLGRLTGLYGTYLALWQLVLMARLPWLEAAFGMERLAVLHRLGGYVVLELLVAHAVFQTAGYELADRLGPVAQLQDFIVSYPGLLAAIVALLLFVAVVVLSLSIVRRGLKYETWYFVHLYAYLGIALAFTHELGTGADFAGNPLFVWYWWALYAVVGAALIGWRVAAPLLGLWRHGFQVVRVVREGPRVNSVHIRGRNLEDLRAQAGQFVICRFLTWRTWWEAHPFSLSQAPNGRHLRVTVKGVGDFTARLPRQVKPGTPVLLEGPFGAFTARARTRERVLLVAGGVGITPIRSLFEELLADGVAVHLIYRCSREKDVIFRSELDRLAHEGGAVVDYVVSEGRRWLRPDQLLQRVPDLAERDVYVCGPTGMAEALKLSLRAAGVGPGQVHTEVFRLS